MAISAENIAKTASIAGRAGLTLALVAAIAMIGESQSPEGVGRGDAKAPQTLPATNLSGIPTVADFPKVGASGDMIGFSHSDSSGTQTITHGWPCIILIGRGNSG